MRVDCVVVGSGIIGLSTAYKYLLARPRHSLIVLDYNRYICEHQSSRNSEVIHAGLYHPPEWLKSKLCRSGREQLYRYCAKYGVGHRKVGKYVVSTSNSESEYLQSLHERAISCHVPTHFISVENAVRSEPLLNSKKVKGVLFSTESGIVDSHALSHSFLHHITSLGGVLSLQTRVCDIKRTSGGFELQVSSHGETLQIHSDIVINAAGLNSDKVSQFVRPRNHEITPLKGYYYTLPNPTRGHKVNRLIYPVPGQLKNGLGVHITIDLHGRLRLGPDAHPNDDVNDYTVPLPGTEEELKLRKKFFDKAGKYLDLQPSDFDRLCIDYGGLRARLKSFGDFVVEVDDGWVDLVGIESPGLTSSLALGDYVVDLLLK